MSMPSTGVRIYLKGVTGMLLLVSIAAIVIIQQRATNYISLKHCKEFITPLAQNAELNPGFVMQIIEAESTFDANASSGIAQE